MIIWFYWKILNVFRISGRYDNGIPKIYFNFSIHNGSVICDGNHQLEIHKTSCCSRNT